MQMASVTPEWVDWAWRHPTLADAEAILEAPDFVERAEAGKLTLDETFALFHATAVHYPEEWQRICRQFIEELPDERQEELREEIRMLWRLRALRIEQAKRREARRASLEVVSGGDEPAVPTV